MVFVLTVILVFFAIFQPGVIIPALAPARPFFLVALLALAAGIMTPSQKSPFKHDPRLSYCIIGLVAAQSISVLQFLYIPQLLDVTIMWCKFLLVYFLVVNVTTDTGRLAKIWTSVCLAVAFLAGHAIWVYHTQGMDHRQLTGGRLSSYGAYSGANDMALVMVIAWPIVFKFIDLNRNLLLKILPVPLLLALIYVDIRTISRAGLIGLSLVMGLSMLKGRSLGKLGRWALLVPAVVIVFILGSKMLLTRGDAQDFSGRDESVQLRFAAWTAGRNMLFSSPIYGVGSDRFVELSDDFGSGHAIQAHNTIIKVFAETGIIGGFSYLGILYFGFQSLWRSRRRFARIKPHGKEVLWAEALGIALIGFTFNTQFSVKAHEWLLYIVAASAVALDRMYKKEAMIRYLQVEEVLALAEGEAQEAPADTIQAPAQGETPRDPSGPRNGPVPGT